MRKDIRLRQGVRIQQLDPKRQNRGTHNHPTSTEVARVIITPTDGKKGRIERDIRVETKEGGLMTIPAWHPAYMALRYILLFPFGEPLHTSRRNYTAGTLSRHNFHFLEDPKQEDGGNDSEQEEDLNANGENAPQGRGGSTRLTKREFYVKWM